METNVAETPMLIIGILSLVAVIAMYIGQGDILTWVSALGCFAALAAFTIVSDMAPEPKKEMQSG